MSSGLSSRFNILQQSPHDFEDLTDQVAEDRAAAKWVPSRYTIRAATDDGRLILWNTYSGAMSIFEQEQVPTLKAILRKPGVSAEPEGLIKYLVDRGYLVKDGTDEYRRFQSAFGQQHYRTDRLELILLSSEDCNFRCQYCYEQFARGTMKPWVREAIKKMVEKRLDSLQSLTVGWFGGEPLYGYPAIEELAPFLHETAAKESLVYYSHMTTNGFLLTPEVADKLLAWRISSYQITIDGPAECHDHNRPTRDGRGTFNQIFENLKSLAKRPDEFKVTIRINYDRRNYPEMGKLFDLIERDLERDPRFRINFHAVGRWGGPNDDNLEVCGTDESAQATKMMESEARRRGFNVGRGLRDINQLGGGVCYAARPYNFVIGATGKLMKCTIALDTEEHNVVGQISEDGDLHLNQDNMALWTEPAFSTDHKCQKCVVLPVCQGIHCPLVRIHEKVSPCMPVRGRLKQGLRKTYELNASTAKRKKISAKQQSL
jgi:uncharacterized protein